MISYVVAMSILVITMHLKKGAYVVGASVGSLNSGNSMGGYESFSPDEMEEYERKKWMAGRLCEGWPSENSSTPAIYCPMPFETDDHSICCQTVGEPRCCAQSPFISVGVKWGIACGVIVSCICLAALSVFLFNRCASICKNQNPESLPRVKVKVNANRREIRPVDKRTLLKTANYTVEQSWDQIMIKFLNREFFERFTDALLSRYKSLKWKDPRREKEGEVTSNKGLVVGLRLLDETRALVVTLDGNTAWVMNDFQNICKNVKLSEPTTIDFGNTKTTLPRSLSPRLPTIGEEFFDAGDHCVKISQNEVEVKFLKDAEFEYFKKILFSKYPTVPWSKYLQRDCAHIQLDNGKAVTIHIWEDIQSVWLSGNGKRDWYNREFQEMYADASKGKLPEQYTIARRSSRPKSSGSRSTERSGSISSAKSNPGIPANYTVKTLDTGGFEIEFPNEDFVAKLKDAFEKFHPNTIWQEYSYRHVTKLILDKGKSVTIQLGSFGSSGRKMWIYDDPGCKIWFNGEFKDLYIFTYDTIHNIEASSPAPETDNESIAPVETTL